ncbi:hypothetical protein ACS0TY_022941 [Phlomoides rotata]
MLAGAKRTRDVGSSTLLKVMTHIYDLQTSIEGGAIITRMASDPRGKGIDLGYEGVLRLEEDEVEKYCEKTPTLCLIGKVLTDKNFNVFGLRETMKKAMNPYRGLTVKEIG